MFGITYTDVVYNVTKKGELMKVIINGIRVGKDDFIELLEAFKANHQKLWINSSKVSLTPEDRILFENLNKAHQQMVVEKQQLKVWKTLQRQRLAQGALQGDNSADRERISQFIAIVSARLFFRFSLRSKRYINEFLKGVFKNERLFKGQYRYNYFGHCWGMRYQFMGMWSLGYHTLQSLGMVPDLNGNNGCYWFFANKDSEYESEAREWNLDGYWSSEVTGADMKRWHNDRNRETFALSTLQHWKNRSPNSSNTFEFHRDVERIKGSLFYELQLYINQRQRIRHETGSDYFRFGFFGQSASDKLRAAKKLQLMCDKFGCLGVKGMLCLTPKEAEALITGSLGQLCAQHWRGPPGTILSLLEQLKQQDPSCEMTIDLKNAVLIDIAQAQVLNDCEPLEVVDMAAQTQQAANAAPTILNDADIAVAVPLVSAMQVLSLS